MLSAATRPIAQVSQGPELFGIDGPRRDSAAPASRNQPEAGLLSHGWLAHGWAHAGSEPDAGTVRRRTSPGISGNACAFLFSNDQKSQHLTLKKMGAGAGRKEARQARRAGISVGRHWRRPQSVQEEQLP